MAELERRVRKVEDDQLALLDAYERLRGRFYGLRGKTSGPPERVPKDELLRRFKANLPLANKPAEEA